MVVRYRWDTTPTRTQISVIMKNRAAMLNCKVCSALLFSPLESWQNAGVVLIPNNRIPATKQVIDIFFIDSIQSRFTQCTKRDIKNECRDFGSQALVGIKTWWVVLFKLLVGTDNFHGWGEAEFTNRWKENSQHSSFSALAAHNVWPGDRAPGSNSWPSGESSSIFSWFGVLFRVSFLQSQLVCWIKGIKGNNDWEQC